MPYAWECKLYKFLHTMQGGKGITICALVGIATWLLLNNIATQIKDVADDGASPPVYIQPLDVQPLYTPSSLVQTLVAWGPQGRELFAMYEFLDMGLFFAAYAGVLLCLFNILRDQLQPTSAKQQQCDPVVPGAIRLGYLSVLSLLLFDLLEDVLQLLLSQLFDDTPQPQPISDAHAAFQSHQQPIWWQVAAHVAAAVHAAKVAAVGLVVLALLASLLAAVSTVRSMRAQRTAAARIKSQ